MPAPVPDVDVEQFAVARSKRRRLDLAGAECLVDHGVTSHSQLLCAEPEPVVKPCPITSSANADGEICGDTFVCFGMVGQLLLVIVLSAYARCRFQITL